MSQVLYRKYRSQNFSELFGQEAVKAVLIQALKDKRVSHAYLFSGPRGTGKTSTARILAKALNCTDTAPKNNHEPCNECSSCMAINEGRYLDLIEIDAASNRGIDEIRELKEKVSFLPAEGGYKIYIIDEVHMLTTEAFNALLKTLEEPPEKVVFILATTEPHKLPLTVISRTQRLDFKLATEEELIAKLQYILKKEKITFDKDALKLIVNAGNGSFRDTETVLEKVLSSYGYKKDKEINIEDVEKILGMASLGQIRNLLTFIYQKEVKGAIDLYRNLVSAGLNQNQLIKQILELARVEMINIISGEASIFSLKFISQVIKGFSEANQEMRYTLVSDLPIELAIVDISKIADVESSNTPAINQPKIIKPVVAIATKVKSEMAIKKESVKDVENVVKEEEKNEEKKVSKEVSKNQSIPTANAGSESQVSLDQVKDKWSVITESAKKYNHHLAAFLSKAKLVGVEGNKVMLHVPFSLHKKQLEKPNSQEKIMALTLEALQVELIVECVINKEARGDIKQESFEPAEENSNTGVVEDIFDEDF